MNAFALRLLAFPLVLTFAAASAQTATPPSAAPAPAAFVAVDVHHSPHSNNPQTESDPRVVHGRYAAHQVTMTYLIHTAFKVDSRYVLEGPPWLDLDRYDIAAAAPPGTSYDQLSLMVRAMLVDRFHLVAHPGQKDAPAYILTVAKPKMLKPAADASAPAGCDYHPPSPNAPPPPPNGDFPVIFTCHNETMSNFASFLRDVGGPYIKSPAVDHTALTGGFDFDIHWSYNPPKGEDAVGTTLFDAVEKQLGLKLTIGTAPLPVVIVDSVNEDPTPNAPDLAQKMPPLPPMSFDVATVKPSAPDAKGMSIQVLGSQVIIRNAPTSALLTIFDDTIKIANPPDSFDKNHWDIVGKFAPDGPSPGPNSPPQINYDDLHNMLQSLLISRFNLKDHMEDRPTDTWAMVAADPHMKKADPSNRTGCKSGPGPDGKDPRVENPMLGRLIYCQNITMPQFAEQLQTMASGFIKNPVVDNTGIQGTYDFLLSFSTAAQLRGTAKTATDQPSTSDATAASAPTGGISLFDALPKEIGIKLVKSKGTTSFLVIDHIDDQPTDN